jgi:opacity protein-like surface antigen
VKAVVALVCMAALAAPTAAQTSTSVAAGAATMPSLRPFFLLSGENFSAHDSFQGVFGGSRGVLWGGGLQIAFRNGLYADITVSRFKKTGDRTFEFGGQDFSLGLPLTIALTPVEATAGYRWTLKSSTMVPYVGAGIGSYGYAEKSQTADASDDFSARHLGYLLVGGAEFRLGEWLRLSGDAQYTRVPGIIGASGLSMETGETDLGGIAARVRVLVGR